MRRLLLLVALLAAFAAPALPAAASPICGITNPGLVTSYYAGGQGVYHANPNAYDPSAAAVQPSC